MLKPVFNSAGASALMAEFESVYVPGYFINPHARRLIELIDDHASPLRCATGRCGICHSMTIEERKAADLWFAEMVAPQFGVGAKDVETARDRIDP